MNPEGLPPDALLGSDTVTIFPDAVEIRHERLGMWAPMRVRLEGAAPFAAGPLAEPLPWTLHSFGGPDPAQWRTDLPHYAQADAGELYPGIAGAWRIEEDVPVLRLTVSPHAGLGAVEFELLSSVALELFPQLDGTVVVAGYTGVDTGQPSPRELWRLWAPAAYQTIGGIRRDAEVRYEPSGGNRIRIDAPGWDEVGPLIVDIPLGRPPGGPRGFYVDDEGYVFLTGRRYAAKIAPDGQPVFLSLLNAASPETISTGEDAGIILTGVAGEGFPTTDGAPQRDYGGGESDGFIARLDRDGVLDSATYFGGPEEDTLSGIAAADGSVYFHGGGAAVPVTANALQGSPSGPGPHGPFLGRWRPGEQEFVFATYAPVGSGGIAIDEDGSLVYAGRAVAGLPVTDGAHQSELRHDHDIYVARLEPEGERLEAATYVSLAGGSGADSSSQTVIAGIALDALGGAVIAANVRIGGGEANVSVRVSRDGQGASNFRDLGFSLANFQMDENRDYHYFGHTDRGNFPTAADALQRAPCGNPSAYYRKTRANGGFIDGTYLPGGHGVMADRRGRYYRYRPRRWRETPHSAELQRMTLEPPAGPSLACAVHSAGRLTFGESVAPGQLVTLAGTGLGPLEPVSAPSVENLPVELAGVRVRFDGIPAGIVSVQHGLVTVLAPGSLTPGTEIAVEIEAAGQSPEPLKVRVTPSLFLLFTWDGHGRGPAAAINEDGTRNWWRDPAPPGSAVAAFGTGAGGRPVSVLVNGRPAQVEYSGPAPGLIPGVTQVNFRIPEATEPGAATVTVFTEGPGGREGFPWPRAEIEIAQ